jgi:hypothetical protein
VRGAIDELDEALSRFEVDEVILSSPAINGSTEERIRRVCGARQKPVRRLHMMIQ